VPEQLLLGVDVGTSAVKVAAYAPPGARVSVAVHAVDLSTPGNGICEVDPRSYWDALAACCADLRREGIDTRSVSALAVAANAETLLPVDDHLEPVRPGIVWLDTRSSQEAADLAERLGAERLAALSGQPRMIPMWPATKMLWLQRHEPRAVARTRWWLQPLDYIGARLTGAAVSDHSEYSSSVLLDIRTLRWSDIVLAEIGVDPRNLPELVPAGTPIGRATSEARAALGLGPTALVVMGGFDQACTAVGAGNVSEGVASESTGTSLALISTIAGPLGGARDVACHVHVVPGRYFLCAHNPAGGLLINWFRDTFAPGLSFAGIDALAGKAEAGSDGLVMLPYLSGSVTPTFDPSARGVLFGLTRGHELRHLARSMFEGVAFALADLVDAEHALGATAPELRSVGGGAKSGLWSQIKADVTGITVRPVVDAEYAGARGAAVLAGAGSGLFSSIEEGVELLVALADAYEPDPRSMETYAVGRRVYEQLYPRLRDLFAVSGGA
jgi:xylulokinase